MKSKQLRWKFEFVWFDLWIGLFYQQKTGKLFFCPLPCLVFSFWLSPRPDVPVCPKCNEEGVKVAFDTGDGWGLGWDCGCGFIQDDEIEWPFGDRYMSAKDLEDHGYKIL